MQHQIASERERIILLSLTHGEKFGRELRDDYQVRARKPMPYGSLYTTLDRIEAKGFIRSRLGDPNPEAGGNRRRFYELTAEGYKALNEVLTFNQGEETEVTHAF